MSLCTIERCVFCPFVYAETLSLEDKQAIAALESEDAGFVQSFRHIIRVHAHFW